MSWSDRLERPVQVPNGPRIVTLEDAAIYFQRLPKSKRDNPLVGDSMRIIIDVAEGRAPDLLAQSAVAHTVNGPVKPLNRGKPGRPWLKRKSSAGRRQSTDPARALRQVLAVRWCVRFARSGQVFEHLHDGPSEGPIENAKNAGFLW